MADKEKCNACELCSDVCPMNAISYNEGWSVIDYDRCIGCGNCVYQCDQGALSLASKSDIYKPPESHDNLY